MRHSSNFFATALLLLSIYAGLQNGAAQNLITNGDFETGLAGWSIFVPKECEGKNCRFDIANTSPHAGTNCVRLQSDDFARFAIGSASSIPVQAGEHYRVTIWMRADAAAQLRPKTSGTPPAAGLVIRLIMHQATGDAEGAHLFIGQANTVTNDTPAELTGALPTDWTKIEANVEIPAGADRMYPSIFCWWTNGTIYADDFDIEKISAPAASAPTP